MDDAVRPDSLLGRALHSSRARAARPAAAASPPPSPGTAAPPEAQRPLHSKLRPRKVAVAPPKSDHVQAAQRVLHSLGFRSAYEVFVTVDEQCSRAVGAAELRKGLRILRVEHIEQVLEELRAFRALLPHHNDAVDARTFVGVLEWAVPARAFDQSLLQAAYRQRPAILERFRQHLPELLRQQARAASPVPTPTSASRSPAAAMPSPRKQTDAEPDADTAHARRCASPRRGRRHRRRPPSRSSRTAVPRRRSAGTGGHLRGRRSCG